MKGVLTLLFIFNSFSLWASMEEVLIEQLDFIHNELNKTPEHSCVIAEKQSENIFVRAQLDHKNLFNCSEIEDFHEMSQYSSYYYCKQRFGKSAWTCAENDKDKIATRLSDNKLMSEIETFAQKTFDEYKVRLAKKCCSGNQAKCLNRFEKLKFIIKDSDKLNAQYVSDDAPVNFQSNQIEISKGKLASQYTKEGVERILLHEFGHVCQFARISESESFYKEFTGADSSCLASTGEKGFQVSNLSALKCVSKKLQEQMKEAKPASKYCFGKWYREAFADMIFRSEMNTVYHWTYDMYRRSIASNYGKVAEYIQCDMGDFPEGLVCD